MMTTRKSRCTGGGGSARRQRRLCAAALLVVVMVVMEVECEILRPDDYDAGGGGAPMTIQQLSDEVDWAPGPGPRISSAICQRMLDPVELPRLALARPYSKYLEEYKEEGARVARSIRALLTSGHLDLDPLRACVPTGPNPRYQAFIGAFLDVFDALGIDAKVTSREAPASDVLACDFYIKKGMRAHELREWKRTSRFAHIILWEYPLIWRDDPVEPERVWSFINWDHLNGYMFPSAMPPDRWLHYFADHIPIRPWAGPRPDGYALILGQVPSDTTVVAATYSFNADVFEIYRNIVASIRREIPGFPIVYRPHPRLETRENYCAEFNATIGGVTVRTAEDEPLEDALAGAAVAVAVSSASLIQAAFMGIPSVSLDPVAPTFRISCHSFAMLRDVVFGGSACRPPRAQWLYDLAYTMWNPEDVRSGDLFRYLFRAGGQQLAAEASAAHLRLESSEYLARPGAEAEAAGGGR